jgi:3-hydroxyacyl-CoA dehydrogenase/enoyl-CoA hydratase/3-hydroxybutyryl-CoA epimerase
VAGYDGAFKPQRAAVIGAGMMGAAIAHVAAAAGLDVVLKDLSVELAERGKGYSRRLVGRALEGGQMSAADGDALLGRIHPTAEDEDAAGAELVIEAVFEDPGLKASVLAAIDAHTAPGALIASNTSTLPITELARSVSRPADFIGLHFFSPVERMPLIEIVVGEQTSEQSVQRARDLAALLRKTPIVVRDSRGFFTSRVIATFIDEALGMLLDGVAAAAIEQASAQAGYPTPALVLCDELSIELLRKIRRQNRAAAEQAAGVLLPPSAAERVEDAMLDRHGRAGRAAGAGFYDYSAGKRIGLWPGLRALASAVSEPPPRDLEERLLFAEALESIRCHDEGVIGSVADANVGSILGIGFPTWTGGVLEYVNGYDGGPAGFVVRARELAARYGGRFEPPASLVELAGRGGRYADGC